MKIFYKNFILFFELEIFPVAAPPPTEWEKKPQALNIFSFMFNVYPH